MADVTKYQYIGQGHTMIKLSEKAPKIRVESGEVFESEIKYQNTYLKKIDSNIDILKIKKTKKELKAEAKAKKEIEAKAKAEANVKEEAEVIATAVTEANINNIATENVDKIVDETIETKPVSTKSELVKQYIEKFGKRPGPMWTEEEILSKLS